MWTDMLRDISGCLRSHRACEEEVVLRLRQGKREERGFCTEGGGEQSTEVWKVPEWTEVCGCGRGQCTGGGRWGSAP